ncbi:oligomeric Golgi complex subunit 7 [Chlamydoabsidia padenii]|nr:oligomeric Golgi complex subunit 7 [Chlamydoabsidia padenii]
MSTTIDVACFSDPKFDAKDWINASFRPPNDNDDTTTTNTIEQETATMITKLQLASEQASRQVGQLTEQVIKSMPHILYEVKLITEDVRATHEGIQKVKENMGGVDLGTDGALDKLRQLHLCKTRMEDCLSALMEAENWNNLESEVSKVMNNNDFEGAESRLQDALSYLATTHQQNP